MTDNQSELLWGGLLEIAEDTGTHLSPGESHCFVNLYNDWLDLWGAILDVYSKDEPLTSLVAADIFSLGKELHWMHRLLHWGNYPLVYRNLRYVWELMALAYFADVDEINVCEITDRPGKSVDEKAAWLKKHEWSIKWATVIRPLRDKVIDRGEWQHFYQIWHDLNLSVHASWELRDRMIDDSALAVKDAFD